MLTLYTYWRSSAAYRVRIALNLKGLDYETRPVHLMRAGGEQHADAYRAVNPQARVPTLVHDGRIVTQSLAILEYLDEIFPAAPLLPTDAAGRARVRSLAHIIASDVQPLQNVSVTQYLQRVCGLDDAQLRAWYLEWITRGLTAIEVRLAGESATGRYSHGIRPTLADCCLVPQCYSSRRFGVDVAQFPTVARIEQACNEIEAFRAAAPENQPDRE
ncbi:MAG: maleylacetoacetate isomerase [Steroidobacteraceae bacterium]